MYKDYIVNLLDELLQFDGESRIRALNQRRKDDKWFRIDKYVNGWGVPNEDGIIFFILEKENRGRVDLVWDLKITKQEEIDDFSNYEFIHIGTFVDGGLFEVRLFV